MANLRPTVNADTSEKMLDVLINIQSYMSTLNDNILKLISLQENHTTSMSIISSPVISNNNSNATTMDQNLILESNRIFLEREARAIKNTILQVWNNKLSYRKDHYWKKIRNENIANVYTTWNDGENIILPEQFQLKKILNEPDSQRLVREQLAKMNFESETHSLNHKVETKFSKTATLIVFHILWKS